MKTISQKIFFKTTPHELYEALMDSKKHAAFTGGVAKISRKVNGKFSVFDGYAQGKNLELVQDKKIVQTWQASDWNASEWSTVCFEFKKKDKGTELVFTHKNVPDIHVKSITSGWKDFYWKPLKELLE